MFPIHGRQKLCAKALYHNKLKKEEGTLFFEMKKLQSMGTYCKSMGVGNTMFGRVCKGTPLLDKWS